MHFQLEACNKEIKELRAKHNWSDDFPAVSKPSPATIKRRFFLDEDQEKKEREEEQRLEQEKIEKSKKEKMDRLATNGSLQSKSSNILSSDPAILQPQRHELLSSITSLEASLEEVTSCEDLSLCL